MRRQGKDVAFLAYGSSVNEAMAAADMLEKDGVSATVVDARFCKPLDTKLVSVCSTMLVFCRLCVVLLACSWPAPAQKTVEADACMSTASCCRASRLLAAQGICSRLHQACWLFEDVIMNRTFRLVPFCWETTHPFAVRLSEGAHPAIIAALPVVPVLDSPANYCPVW